MYCVLDNDERYYMSNMLVNAICKKTVLFFIVLMSLGHNLTLDVQEMNVYNRIFFDERESYHLHHQNYNANVEL